MTTASLVHVQSVMEEYKFVGDEHLLTSSSSIVAKHSNHGNQALSFMIGALRCRVSGLIPHGETPCQVPGRHMPKNPRADSF